MGFNDLFKSPAQRKAEAEKELRQKERTARRKAENAIETGRERIVALTKGNDRTWQKAKEHLQNGRKESARREIEKYRTTELLIGQLERKNWVCEHYLIRLDNAQVDNQFAEAVAAIAEITPIHPERIMDAMDKAGDKLEDQTEIDRYWDRLHDRTISQANVKESDTVLSVDTMMNELESEVAHDVGGTNATANVNVKERSENLRKEMEKLIGNEEKK